MNKNNLPFIMIVGKMMHEYFKVLKKRTSDQSDIILTMEPVLCGIFNIKL